MRPHCQSQYQSHCQSQFIISCRRVGIGAANVLVMCLAELRSKLPVLPVRPVLRLLFLESMPLAVLPRGACGHNQQHRFDYKLVASSHKLHAQVRPLLDDVGELGKKCGEKAWLYCAFEHALEQFQRTSNLTYLVMLAQFLYSVHSSGFITDDWLLYFHLNSLNTRILEIIEFESLLFNFDCWHKIIKFHTCI